MQRRTQTFLYAELIKVVDCMSEADNQFDIKAHEATSPILICFKAAETTARIENKEQVS